MKKTRKPLGDALAEQFVYGEIDKPVEPVEPIEPIEPVEPAPPPVTNAPNMKKEKTQTLDKSRESSLMNMLQTEPKEPTVRFTVDLSESMHRKLSILAAQTGRKKADIVRMLLDKALADVTN